MQITILNQYKLIKVDHKAVKKLTEFFVQQATKKSHSTFPYHHLAFLLVGNEEIKHYKITFFDKNEITDVIVVPQEPAFSTMRKTADIIINVEIASQQAKKRKSSFEEEFALYLAHAIDHLTGASDKTSKQRNIMLRREKLWVAAAKEKALLDSLVTKCG